MSRILIKEKMKSQGDTIKILWFPRLQFDTDRLHITTWREMCRELEQLGCKVRIAIAGKDSGSVFDREYTPIFLIRKRYFRILTFWLFGYIKFFYTYIVFRPNVVILDVFSYWFSMPFVLLPKRSCLFLLDNRTPIYNSFNKVSTWEDKVSKYYTKLCFLYCKFLLDGMTVITEHYKQRVHRECGFKTSRLGVWSSGVNIEQFSNINRERPAFLKDKFVLMQHGGITYNRGLLETLDAMSMVEEDIVLVLLGEGDAEGEILRRIENYGLKNRVYLFPRVPHSELPLCITYCDCAIMAYPNIEYWNNNNPIKLLEYLSMGKVVICTDMWTFRDVCGDTKASVYISDNKPEFIAHAIDYCYKN
ncbi:MAG: glycosyltransferase, partial [Thermoplasmata archaeon]